MHNRRDAWLVALAGIHGVVLVAAPTAPVIAVGLWWNSNTVAHNFVHRPFFRSRSANVGFALVQTLLLGVPQTFWRDRHLAHHAGRPWRPRWSGSLAVEVMLVLGLWATLVLTVPTFFLWTYAPAYAAGLALCALHGWAEHLGATTTSHYGRLYNQLCFNDGYHVEHHAQPGMHWSELPARRAPAIRPGSRWPPLLRWLEVCSLDGLERVVLGSPRLQRFVVAAHARAFAALLAGGPPVRSVAIVGGGLFPRSALVCGALFPDARLVLIDAEPAHLDGARVLLRRMRPEWAGRLEFRHETFVPEDRERPAGLDADLLVVPLALRGDRSALYVRPPAARVLVHDWAWRRVGASRLVSVWLLKRVNLVHR